MSEYSNQANKMDAGKLVSVVLISYIGPCTPPYKTKIYFCRRILSSGISATTLSVFFRCINTVEKINRKHVQLHQSN